MNTTQKPTKTAASNPANSKPADSTPPDNKPELKNSPPLKTDHKEWLLVDASKRPLGRLASQTAGLLRGKHKPEFAPHLDIGDFVVVVNAQQVHLSGRKWTNKKYFSHSGFFGSLKTKTARELSGSQLIRRAVYGMLPKNKLRDRFIKKLKIYETGSHPHKAQKPKAVSL